MLRFMKIFLILLLYFCIGLLSACKPANGQLVAAPAGLEDAIRKSSNGKTNGFSVRQYGPDKYLVTADVEYTFEANKPPSPRTNTLVAQRAQGANGEYWQIIYVLPKDLKSYGIDP